MICVDSDCLIDFLNGKEDAINIFKKYMGQIVTTEVNLFEVFFGIYIKKHVNEKDKKSAELFFDSIPILSVNDWGKNAAINLTNLIKKGKTIDQNDCFIASIILNSGFNKIITRNVKHFSRISSLEVITY